MAAFSPCSLRMRANSLRSGTSAASMIASRSTLADEGLAEAPPPAPVDRPLGERQGDGVDDAISGQGQRGLLEVVRGTTRLQGRCAGPPRRRPGPAGQQELLGPRAPISQGMTIVTTPEPNRISGSPNKASSAATARSHIIMRSHPPARQYPWTCAITGLGWSKSLEHPADVARRARRARRRRQGRALELLPPPCRS